MVLDKLNFWADYYAAGRELSKRDRMELWDAILAYAFEGVTPKLKGAPSAVFIALKARVDGSIQGAENVKKRKGMASPKANPKEAPREGASEAPREGDAPKTARPIGGVQEYKSTRGREEDEEEGFTPPTPDEASAYFSANCLKGDPSQFVDFYAAQDWRKSNGQAIADWRAQARNWHREQVKRNAEAAARGEPPAESAVWKPAETPEQELARLDAEAERNGWS